MTLNKFDIFLKVFPFCWLQRMGPLSSLIFLHGGFFLLDIYSKSRELLLTIRYVLDLLCFNPIGNKGRIEVSQQQHGWLLKKYLVGLIHINYQFYIEETKQNTKQDFMFSILMEYCLPLF